MNLKVIIIMFIVLQQIYWIKKFIPFCRKDNQTRDENIE